MAENCTKSATFTLPEGKATDSNGSLQLPDDDQGYRMSIKGHGMSIKGHGMSIKGYGMLIKGHGISIKGHRMSLKLQVK